MRALNVPIVCPSCGQLDTIKAVSAPALPRALYECSKCSVWLGPSDIKKATRQRVIEEAKKYLGDPSWCQDRVQRIFVRENIEHTPDKFGVTSKVPRPHSLTFAAMEYAGKFPGGAIEHWFEWELTGGDNFDVALPEPEERRGYEE